eukprot:1558281-Rhodomonas_salina.1
MGADINLQDRDVSLRESCSTVKNKLASSCATRNQISRGSCEEHAHNAAGSDWTVLRMRRIVGRWGHASRDCVNGNVKVQQRLPSWK